MYYTVFRFVGSFIVRKHRTAMSTVIKSCSIVEIVESCGLLLEEKRALRIVFGFVLLSVRVGGSERHEETRRFCTSFKKRERVASNSTGFRD